MKTHRTLVLLVASGTVLAQGAQAQSSSASWLDTVKSALHLNSTPAPSKPANPAQKPATPTSAKPAATPASAQPAAAQAAAAKPGSTVPARPGAAPVNVKANNATVVPVAAPVKPAPTVRPAVSVASPAVPANAKNSKQAGSPAQNPATVKEVSIGSPFKGMTKPEAKAAIKTQAAAEPKVEPAMIKTEIPVTPPKPLMERDPFVSPIMRASGGTGACETGKRCLVVDQITLRGVVRGPNGMIAVVENAARRAYFLRVNDPVFNGTVVKITGDSIMFREVVKDKVGKESTRDVVKKVSASAA